MPDEREGRSEQHAASDPPPEPKMSDAFRRPPPEGPAGVSQPGGPSGLLPPAVPPAPPPPAGAAVPPPPAGAAPAASGPWSSGGVAPTPGPVPRGDDRTATHIGGLLLPLRPLTISDILDGAFRGLRTTFLPVALLVLILVGPLQLGLNLALSRILPATVGDEVFFDIDGFEEAVVSVEDLMSMVNVTLVAAVLGFVITLVVSVAVIALILQVDRGERPQVRAAVTGSWRRVLVTLGSSALALLGGLVAFVLWLVVLVFAFTEPLLGILLLLVSIPVFIIGASAYFGYMNLLVPIAVVEGRGVVATMGRAWWVLRSRFWRVVGLSLLVGLLVSVVGGVLQFPFVLGSMFVGGFGWIVQSVGEILAQVISIPVTMFAVLLIYLDARVRLEGLDLALQMRSFEPS